MNLLDYDRPQLIEYFQSIGEKPYHGQQIFKWIHQQGVTDFNLMTNLSTKLRATLHETAEIKAPELAHEHVAADGVIKWMLRLADGNAIETVYIPEVSRGTLCVSSQVGCALNCTFCSTAQQGFNRNLSVAEIIGQVWFAVRRLSQQGDKHDKAITNVVMMGMGEPLLNYDAVLTAMNIMMDDEAYGLSKYRVTLSTSGVVPMMERLRDESEVALAVSLHAPNNALRDILVPINKKYPLEVLMAVCRDYFKKKQEKKRSITMEYVMLENVNDKPEHAKELCALLKNIPAKINLIPFNPFPNADYRCSSRERIEKFRQQLLKAGFNAITRKTRGDDINAACGQLVGSVDDRTRRQERNLRRINIPVEVTP